MMNLETLRNNWESLAERDALFAILTDHRRVGGKWDVDEFMATGEAEIETVMHHLASIGCIPNYAGKAFDFGCGVGRVTQALAPRFASCVGVDISRQMIDKARSLNRYAHCRYVANSTEQLPFADASFTFIYSNIVLQHVPRRFSTAYLGNLYEYSRRAEYSSLECKILSPHRMPLPCCFAPAMFFAYGLESGPQWEPVRGKCKCIVCRSVLSGRRWGPPESWMFNSLTRRRRISTESLSICGRRLHQVMLANSTAW